MADCNSLEALMTSLTNEVATLKVKVANLEAKQNNYATKNELQSAVATLNSLIDNLRGLIESVRELSRMGLEQLRALINDLLNRFLSGSDLEGRVRILEIKVGGLESVTNSLRRAIEAVQGRLNRLEARVSSFESTLSQLQQRLSGLENTVGQILQDIRNIYNTLTNQQRSIDDLRGQIRALWAALAAAVAAAIAAAIAAIWAAIAGLKAAIAAIQGQIAALWAAIRALSLRPPLLPPSGGVRNGRDGLNGLNGRNGRNGIDGKNGRDGLNGIRGFNGFDGRDGRDGKDGKDLKMEFSTISVTVFDSCNQLPDGTSTPIFSSASVQVIKGLEIQVYKEFAEIAKSNALKCSSKLEFVKIDVTIFEACETKEDGTIEPKFIEKEVDCIKGSEKQVKEQFEQIAKLNALQCKKTEELVAYAAVPEWWQIRPEGRRPQIVLQFCEKLPDGKYGAPKYVITVPHASAGDEPISSYPLTKYKKGNFEGELKLADNSKVIVNCKSKGEAERVLSAIRGSIKGGLLKGSSIKYSERNGKAIEEKEVYLRIVTYFKNGIENASDFTWKKKFPLP